MYLNTSVTSYFSTGIFDLYLSEAYERVLLLAQYSVTILVATIQANLK